MKLQIHLCGLYYFIAKQEERFYDEYGFISKHHGSHDLFNFRNGDKQKGISDQTALGNYTSKLSISFNVLPVIRLLGHGLGLFLSPISQIMISSNSMKRLSCIQGFETK